MTIDTIMYFALGFLVAGLLALMILPQVWKRAVRLTTKRIEAATPITLAEFRADKDQLRAEFALSTRRLEMNVETLRRRLAEQLGDINKRKTDLASVQTERETHAQMVRELEEREADARRRVLELEKEGADIAQRLRMRDREYADKVAQLEAMRDAVKQSRPGAYAHDGKALTGSYNADIETLLSALATERSRAEFLENQSRALIAQLENSDRRTSAATEQTAEFRETATDLEGAAIQASNELIAAEARIADAENRLNSLLSETTAIVERGEERNGELLADKLKLEDELEKLKAQVHGVEAAVVTDWGSDRIEQAHLREKLNDIASEVSRIVYALDGSSTLENGESLFERVQKFAGDAPAKSEERPRPLAVSKPPRGRRTAVSDRLAALRDIQRRR